jgi:integrase
MTSIPNTKRRGAIYWFRRSCRLPDGNGLRPTVSLRTSCPKEARRRAAVLAAKFEEIHVRLFGSSERRFALDADAAARVFKNEFNKALDVLEDERERSKELDYDFGSIDLFIDVHEAIYGYLAKTNFSESTLTFAEWAQMTDLDGGVEYIAQRELSNLSGLWYQNLDETAQALIDENIDTELFLMEHASRLRFEARLAAVQEYRRRLENPSYRFESFLATTSKPSSVAQANPASTQRLPLDALATDAPAPDPSPLALLSPEQIAIKFIEENPKLLGSTSGKRGAKWTPKTKSQFEAAMRLLQKSMGSKPFIELSDEDLRQLLRHFDGLPPNHHKSPRHGPMTLADICEEAQNEVRNGNLDPECLGLNVPTLNRHFRYIRMAHDWVRRAVPQAQVLDWKALSFDDTRNAREQRQTFPLAVAKTLFSLPPWQGCANARQRFNAGDQIIHDSLYWILPIIWYSGMRREEACKLCAADIKVSDDGIVYFDVADTEAGRLKNVASRRLIPVADELLRLGFLEFVELKRTAQEELLFPELLSETRNMGESYYRLGWSKITTSLDAKPEGLTIHGIRHMVADELKAAGINEEVRADLLGHALQSETAGRYSKASRLKVLREAVNTIPLVTQTVEAATVSLRA